MRLLTPNTGLPLTPHQQQQLVAEVNIRMAASADAALFAPLAPLCHQTPADASPATAKAATPAAPAGSGVSTQTTMPAAPAIDPVVDARVAAPPLALLHDVVANVATRLALLRCHAESQALAEGGWRGGLRVGERGGLTLSQRYVWRYCFVRTQYHHYRVVFWVDALPLTGHAGEAVNPPAIDLGQTDDGTALLAVHVPPLTNPLTDAPFALETPTCDVRMLPLLTTAATHHAVVQLGMTRGACAAPTYSRAQMRCGASWQPPPHSRPWTAMPPCTRQLFQQTKEAPRCTSRCSRAMPVSSLCCS